MSKNLRITVRVEERDRQQIERLIKTKKFRNLSQVIRAALENYLNTNEDSQ